MLTALVLPPYFCEKNQDQMQPKERVYLSSISTSQYSREGKQVINSSWERGGKNWKLWRNITYWFTLQDLLSQPSCITQKHLPKSGTAQSGLCLCTSITSHENAPKTWLEIVWWIYFLNFCSLLLDHFSLYQIDSKTGQHIPFMMAFQEMKEILYFIYQINTLYSLQYWKVQI